MQRSRWRVLGEIYGKITIPPVHGVWMQLITQGGCKGIDTHIKHSHIVRVGGFTLSRSKLGRVGNSINSKNMPQRNELDFRRCYFPFFTTRIKLWSIYPTSTMWVGCNNNKSWLAFDWWLVHNKNKGWRRHTRPVKTHVHPSLSPPLLVELTSRSDARSGTYAICECCCVHFRQVHLNFHTHTRVQQRFRARKQEVQFNVREQQPISGEWTQNWYKCFGGLYLFCAPSLPRACIRK